MARLTRLTKFARFMRLDMLLSLARFLTMASWRAGHWWRG